MKTNIPNEQTDWSKSYNTIINFTVAACTALQVNGVDLKFSKRALSLTQRSEAESSLKGISLGTC